MGISVTVPGLGTTSNVKSFSVQEDATPIEPSSSAGGVGSITTQLNDFPDSALSVGSLLLAAGSRGKTSGAITTLSSRDGDLAVTADSVLGMFNTTRTAQPYVGTLGGAVQYYCDLVGITNNVVVDASVASRSVIYPGWIGNVWVFVKQMLSAEQVEMSLVFDRVSVRPLRVLTINKDRMTSSGYDLDGSNAAQSIEITYYNNSTGTQLEVFPLTTEDPQIIVVDAGATQVVTQKLNASLSSVNQPVVQDFVNDTSYAGTNGVYAVSGNDGLPITAAQWTAQGGSLSVRITEDPSILEITVVGASGTDYAPYRIAMSSGSSNYYNALHITGTGVVWNEQVLTLLTGNAATSTEVGVTVTNPYVSTLAQAYNLGIKTAQAYAGLNYTYSGTAYDVNRDGQGRDLIGFTIADFNAAGQGPLISTFNTAWSGQTIAQFNEFWQAQVDLIWENQVFGNVTGARVLTDEVNFRVINATTSESSVQFSATLDTMISDFNVADTGRTVANFNTTFSGLTCKQFSLVPLR